MPDPDYLGFAQMLNAGATNAGTQRQQAYQANQDQYADYAKRMASNSVAAGDYAGAAAAFGQAGDAVNAQAAALRALDQQGLTAASQGDVAGARSIGAQTGDPTTYGQLQDAAVATASQRGAAVARTADLLSSIKAVPGETDQSLQQRRAGALQTIQSSGMYAQTGTSPEAVNGFLQGPLDDGHLALVSQALTPLWSGKLGENETAVVNGRVAAQGVVKPVTASPDQRVVAPLNVAGTAPGAVVTPAAPMPVATSPGQMLRDPVTGAPVGGQTPFEPKPVVTDATQSANSYDPNSNTFNGGAPSRSPVSAGMVRPSGAAGTSGPNMPPGSASGAQAFAPQISAAEQKYGIPPGLLSSLLVNGERSGPNAVSPKGAVGIAQIMPATAAALGVDPRDPNQAIDGAARYLAQNASQFGGDWTKAVAAYNAGPGAVSRANGVPNYPETQQFVQRVTGGRPPVAQPPVAGQGVASVPGQRLQPGGFNGLPGFNLPNGGFQPVPGAGYTTDNALNTRNQFLNSEEYKGANNAVSAANALHLILQSSTGNGGVVDMAALDNTIRAQTGLSARQGSVTQLMEHLGVPQEIQGKVLNLTGNGFITPTVIQQMQGVLNDYAGAHVAVLRQRQQSDTQFARGMGFQGDLQENVPGLTPTPRVNWMPGGQGAPGGQPQPAAQATAPPALRLAADAATAMRQYAGLPSGATYLAPDGLQRRKR